MRNATKIFTSTFGIIMALAGLEHGIGEVLQGNVAPSGVMILSWPESAFFHSLGGEPAMTIIPNLLLTGILAIFFSLLMLVWSILFVQRKNGGLIMILLCIAMLLAGGGMFPPILGIIIGAVGTRINAPLTWRRKHLPLGLRHFLARLWPYFYAVCIPSWFALVPGIPILSYFFGVNSTVVLLGILFFALSTLLLTILAGFAYDSERQTDSVSGRLISVAI
ncbi:MAG TPA: hypothetical protein VK249_02235 [Anaerolineales bacterium]|nr:hypothetical protein [Anaerolineales bacterium]